MKKALVLLLVLALTFSVAACGPTPSASAPATAAPASAAPATAAPESAAPAQKIKIGVSIWSSTDTLGSQCKTVLDEAAQALGVDIQYVDQGHVSEQVTASVETLAAAGCQGIIICNSSSAEMTSVINTCNQAKVYVAQFFRVIDKTANPNEYELACSSPYYVGCVHESEVDNGANLVRILAEKGSRKIAIQGWQAGDATFLGRWEGYKKGAADWNAAHPNDQVTLLEPQYGGTTSDTGRACAEALLNANPDMDALIVAGGGGDPLIGAIAAIEAKGLTGKVKVMSTDFLKDLDQQLAKGAIAGESGGHFTDPMFAFLMVYNAITGKYPKVENGFYEIIYPYVYVASSQDYADFAKYFVESPPYTPDEIRGLANMSFDELKAACAKLSIEDVKARHGA